LHFTGKSLTDVAQGAKPPAPPGQGPCDHGNGDTNGNAGPCKEDPSPNGKDCEEHGKKGGVNEDHCKGDTETTPTETTPTETTPTETTPTETTPTTPEETTTSTETTPTGTVPPPSTVPAEGSSATPPAVKVTELEKQLQNQTKKNAQGIQNPGEVQAANELPYTGFSLAWVVALGLGLVALGGYLKGYRIVRTFKA
jgi:LPXTG-motif cell wall-anchored protein